MNKMSGVYRDLRIKIREEYYDKLKQAARDEDVTVLYLAKCIIEDFLDQEGFVDEEA